MSSFEPATRPLLVSPITASWFGGSILDSSPSPPAERRSRSVSPIPTPNLPVHFQSYESPQPYSSPSSESSSPSSESLDSRPIYQETVFLLDRINTLTQTIHKFGAHKMTASKLGLIKNKFHKIIEGFFKTHRQITFPILFKNTSIHLGIEDRASRREEAKELLLPEIQVMLTEMGDSIAQARIAEVKNHLFPDILNLLTELQENIVAHENGYTVQGFLPAAIDSAVRLFRSLELAPYVSSHRADMGKFTLMHFGMDEKDLEEELAVVSMKELKQLINEVHELLNKISKKQLE